MNDYFLLNRILSRYLVFLCPRKNYFLDLSLFLICLVFSYFSFTFTTIYKLTNMIIDDYQLQALYYVLLTKLKYVFLNHDLEDYKHTRYLKKNFLL